MGFSVDVSINQTLPFPITRHSTAASLFHLIRNPLDALPPAVFHEPVVVTRQAGGLKV